MFQQNGIVSDRKNILVFFVNGKKVTESNANPEHTLLFYLREKLKLCGTKSGCGEGGCGACTVMVSKYDRKKNEIRHFAVNACLMPVCAVHGLSVITVEGIGSIKTKLHPVQERIAKSHGTQCGFCTPGFVMSMYALLRNSPQPSMKELEIAFQGNLCRCTGYRPIIEGYRTFTKEYQNECAMGDQCCRNQKTKSDVLFEKSEFMPFDVSQEPIFPPELKVSDEHDNTFMSFQSDRVKWFRPLTLSELQDVKRKHPDAKIVIGNTEVGIEMKIKNIHYPVLISPVLIPEMNDLHVTPNGVYIGASVTLDDIDIFLKQQINELPPFKTQIFVQIVEMFHWFAGQQIRNVASIGGNIMTSSPISDLNPILLAAGVELTAMSHDGKIRKIIMNEQFFTSYRENAIKSHEILVSLIIPFTEQNQHFLAYKQSKRRDDDIAIVNAAFNLKYDVTSDKILDLKLAFGGMAPTTILASISAEKSIGQSWNDTFLEMLNQSLINEIPLPPNAPGGMIMYRRTLTLSLFFKAFLEISERLGKSVPENDKSGITKFHALPPNSSQLFEIVQNSEFHTSPVGKPIVHVSSYQQATGEAIYCDDIPHSDNELFIAFVLSSKAHAKIISIDASAALAVPGVAQFFSAKDISDDLNLFGPTVDDEEYFASKFVNCHGKIIGAIVADTQEIARHAVQLVKVDYEEIHPIIVTIEDAIKYNSYFDEKPAVLERGDVDNIFLLSDHVIQGSCRTGAQEHFYMETHGTLAIPRDADEIEMFCGTQSPMDVQKRTAKLLRLPMSNVSVRTKRIGGGFGGKNPRTLMTAVPTAFAAYKLNRPVRCILTRDEDMLITGMRHPFLFQYKVGFTSNGEILALELFIYCNGGCSTDLSMAVVHKTMFHCTNSIFIPNLRIKGWACKTNLPSNTAFRGFGVPQGMFAAETIYRDVAQACGLGYEEIFEKNYYKENISRTPFNQIVRGVTVKRCWDEVIKNSDYYIRKDKIEEFNKLNRWKKRGISIVPVFYGLSFGVLFMNQAGALVNVYADGSVNLFHGGIEMGQGLATKMIQVASHCLKIPIERIHTSEVGTDKIPNTQNTAASASADINGMAVIDACGKIMERLKPYMTENPDKGWNFWVNQAYFGRVSLSATGFYKTPNLGFNKETQSNDTYNYFTQGAGCSEVEIDCLTGDHRVIRTDIVMDVGSSLNPAIDMGQIEGSFLQGYGMFTMEEMLYSPNGIVISRGPGVYKIPTMTDIPGEFNVALLTGAPNPKAIYSSKAAGEPPLGLGSSVYFAIREAIIAARKDEGLDCKFELNAPATVAKIRMACSDKFTKNFKKSVKGSFIPWRIEP